MQRSWEIAKRSWAVLRSDRSLAWFPVLSSLASLLILGVLAGVIAAIGGDNRNGDGFQLGAVGYVLIAVAYVAVVFAGTYFLAALVAGADQRLRGEHATVESSLRMANARLHRLLPWALVSGTVSIVLRALEQRGIVGRLVGSLLGMAWSLLTFLTVPVLVLENVGVGDALRRSKELFTRTWGENVVGQAGVGLVGMFAVIPGVALVAIGAATGSIVGVVALGGIGVGWILVTMIVLAALSGIYRTALYHYAATGTIPAAFEGTDLTGAFVERRDGTGRGPGLGGFGGFGRPGGFGGGFGGFAR
jgi:hypothetical protein